MPDGKETTANGYYMNGEIYIDINAGKGIISKNAGEFVSLFQNCLRFRKRQEVKVMKYRMFPHFIVVEKRVYKSYGIVATEKNCAVLVLKDVSMDRNSARQLVKDLNTQQIRLKNLDAVLNNFFEQ